jgi:hypothetical protein
VHLATVSLNGLGPQLRHRRSIRSDAVEDDYT